MRKARQVPDTLEGGSARATLAELPEIEARENQSDPSPFTSTGTSTGSENADSTSFDPIDLRSGRKRNLRRGVALLCASGLLVSTFALVGRHRANSTPTRRFMRAVRRRARFF